MNARILVEDGSDNFFTPLFVTESFASCLAACAHLFSTRANSLLIPSSHYVMDLEPIGSHPMLDPNYSSGSLQEHNDALGFSRMDKMRMLCENNDDLVVIRVCSEFLGDDVDTNTGKGSARPGGGN